jgi:hypothetical protein
VANETLKIGRKSRASPPQSAQELKEPAARPSSFSNDALDEARALVAHERALPFELLEPLDGELTAACARRPPACESR